MKLRNRPQIKLRGPRFGVPFAINSSLKIKFDKCKQLKFVALLLGSLLFSTSAQGAIFYVDGVLHFTYKDSQGVIRDAQWSTNGTAWTLDQINLKRNDSAAGTDGPPAAGDPFTSLSIVGSQFDMRFTYRDATGAIQDVLMPGGQFLFSPGVSAGLQQINLKSANPSARTAAPAAAGDPVVLNVGTHKHFVSRDSSGTIWDAWYNGSTGKWTLEQITSTPSSAICGPLVCFGYMPGIAGLSNGPPAAGDPFVVAYNQQLHYAYRDGNGNIQDAWYDGSWHLDQINNGPGKEILPVFCSVFAACPPGLTPGPPAGGDPFVLVGVGNQLHFAYRDAQGNVWDSYNEGNGSWGLDQVPMGSSRAASGPVASVYEDKLHFTYVDLNGAVYDASHLPGNNNWTVQQLNLGGMTNGPAAASNANSGGGGAGLSAAVVTGTETYSINGACTAVVGAQHLAYRDISGSIQHLWYNTAFGWHVEAVLPQPPSPCTYPLELIGPTRSLFTAGFPISGVTVNAGGGTGGYIFTVVSGLPNDGLSLFPSGALIGTPAKAATFPVNVTVRDSSGNTALGSFMITILSPLPPTLRSIFTNITMGCEIEGSTANCIEIPGSDYPVLVTLNGTNFTPAEITVNVTGTQGDSSPAVVNSTRIEAGILFPSGVHGSLSVTVTTPGGTSNAVILHVERFGTGGGPGMCTARNQKQSPSSPCCPGLETNQAGFCEPKDPPGCGLVSSFPAAPCCHNKAACETNGICLSDPTANNFLFCAPTQSSKPSPCPGGKQPQVFSCKVDGCPYSNGNLTTLQACSNDDATNIVTAANPQCEMVNCIP